MSELDKGDQNDVVTADKHEAASLNEVDVAKDLVDNDIVSQSKGEHVGDIVEVVEEPAQEEAQAPEPEAPPEDQFKKFNASLIECSLRTTSDVDSSKKLVMVSAPDVPVADQMPTIVKVNESRSKKNCETLKKLKNAFQDLNQFTAFFECHVKCPSSDSHMFKAVKWSEINKDNYSNHYCYNCGYTKSAGGLGFYQCNVDEYYRFCCECLMETRHPPDIPEEKKFNMVQQKIVLCKEFLTSVSDKSTKWICHSIYQKGNQDIPDDWAVCESGLDDQMTQKHYDDNNFYALPKYVSLISNASFCLKCLHKWKRFDADPDLDYTQYKINKTTEQLNQLQAQQVTIDLNQKPSREQGQDLYKKLATSYIEKNLMQKITSSEIQFYGFQPTQEDFDMKLKVFNPQIKFAETIDSYIEERDIQFVRTPSEYFPVIRTYERLKLKGMETDMYVKTLRLYDDEKNFQHIKTIVVETLPSYALGVERLPTYLHYRDCLYYFKRIYLDQQPDKKEEVKEEAKENESEAKPSKPEENGGESKPSDENKPEEKKEEKPAENIKPVKSYLQLFRYKLTTGVETRVKNYVFWEKDYYLAPVMNKVFGEKFMIFSEDPGHNKLVLDNLEKAKQMIQKLYAEKYSNSIIVNINLMEIVYESGDYQYWQIQAAIENGFLVNGEFINQEFQQEEEIEHPKEDQEEDPVIESYELEFLKRQYCLMQRHARMITEHNDSDDEESQDEEVKVDENGALGVDAVVNPPDETNNDDEASVNLIDLEEKVKEITEEKKVKKQRRPYKKNFKIFRMDNIKTPIASFSNRNKDKYYTDEPIRHFYKTLEVTTTEFYEEHDWPDLQMAKNQTYIPKDKTIVQKKAADGDEIKTRAVFVFKDAQKYRYVHNLSDETNEEGQIQTDFNRKHLTLYTFNYEYLDSSMNVQAVKLDGIFLPNQQTECSYTQYVLYDYSYCKFRLLYPFFTPDQYVEQTAETGDNKDDQLKTNKQTYEDYIIAEVQKKFSILDSSIMGINVSSNTFEKNHPLQFKRDSEIQSLFDSILKLRLSVPIYTSTRFTLVEDQCKHTLFVWREDNNNVSILNFIEDHIFVNSYPLSENKLKYWPQKVNKEYMEQFPDGNPEISLTQKFVTRVAVENDGTVYRNSQVRYCLSTTYYLKKLIKVDENGYMEEESFYNDKYDKTILMEDLSLAGQYKMVLMKDFTQEVEKKVEGSHQVEKVKEEVTNDTQYLYYQYGKTNVIFIFKINSLMVFVRKDIFNDQMNESTPLMTLTSLVHVMKRIKNGKISFQQMTIEKLLKLTTAQKKSFQNIELKLEKIIDNEFRSNYVALIYSETQDGYSCYGAKNISLVFINIDDLQTASTSIQPPQAINDDVYTYYFKIQRVSGRILIGEPKKDFQQYDTIYAVGYYVANQGDRYEFYDVSLNEKVHLNDKGHDVTKLQIDFLGRNMIMASSQEQAANYQYDFYLLPLYCLKGNEQLGTVFVKNSSSPIQLQIHSRKPGEIIELKNYDAKKLTPFGNSFRGNRVDKIHKDKSNKVKELVNQSHFKYRIKRMMKFDIKKAFIVNKEGKQDRYYLLVKVNMQRTFAYNPMFANFELHHFLNQTGNGLLNMVPFTFRNLLFEGVDHDVSQLNHFKKLEILNGQTLADLFLKDPVHISKALKLDNSLDKSKTFLEKYYSDQRIEYRKKAIEVGFFYDGVSYLQSDFTQVNQLMRAYEMKATKSANLLIEHIFSLENKHMYQNEIMMCLIQILEQKKIGNGFIQFFGQADEQATIQQLCNLEMKILHSQVPLFSKKEWNVIKIFNIQNFQNYEQEMVDFMKMQSEGAEAEKEEDFNAIEEEKKPKEEEKKEEAVKPEQDEEEQEAKDNIDNLFDINNTMIDFRYLIIGQKLQTFKRGEKSYIFDDYTLSEMISNMPSNINIFNQTSVKRLIDYQFKQTKTSMQLKFLSFLILYFIPFLVVCFIQEQAAEAPILTLSLVTQLYFFGIELVQMSQISIIGYVKEGLWNFVEFTQFVCFVALYVLRAVGKFLPPDEKRVDILCLQLYLIVVGFIKILFFIRIYEDYGFLVQMVGNTMIQLIPFIVFFFMWVLFFGCQYWILRVEIDSADDDYLNLTEFFRYFFMTYRNSIGDISTPGYENWDKIYSDDVRYEYVQKNWVIFLIWMVWLVNQILNLIILLNFLIAVISQVYDNVVADQQMLSYKHRAELNKEHYMLQKFYGRLQEFQILIFQIDKEVVEAEEDQFVGFVQTLKNFITKQNGTLIKRIDQVNEELTEQIHDDSNLTKQSLKIISDTVTNLSKDNKRIIQILSEQTNKDLALHKMLSEPNQLQKSVVLGQKSLASPDVK